MIRRILIAWLCALLLCAALTLVLNFMLGLWTWDDPFFRKYIAFMALLLSLAATSPVYDLLWRRRTS